MGVCFLNVELAHFDNVISRIYPQLEKMHNMVKQNMVKLSSIPVKLLSLEVYTHSSLLLPLGLSNALQYPFHPTSYEIDIVDNSIYSQ